MITSIFNKSKPINYISVFIIIVLAFILMLFKHNYLDFSLGNLGLLLFNFTLVFLSLFITNFIIQKNSLAKDNNFTSLCFGLFISLLPQVFLDTQLLLANICVLLAFRRLVSLSSNRNTIKKLLDSGVFIAIASLFYIWSIWFMVLPLLALIYHSEKTLKYWVIPVIGFLSIVIVSYAVFLCEPNMYVFKLDLFVYSINFDTYNSLQIIAAMTLVVVLSLWALFYYVPNIKDQKRLLWPAYKLTGLFLLISVLVIFLQPYKTGSEFILLGAPFAIICANYFQIRAHKWFKESIFFTWILLAVVLAIVT